MTPNRDEVVKRRLGGIMDALQAVYDLVQANYMDEDFGSVGEARELAARVMTDIRLLADRQMEAQ